DPDRHLRPVPDLALPVPAGPARHLDRRDARAGLGDARPVGGGPGRRAMSHQEAPVTPYGLLARFPSPEALGVGARSTNKQGYRRVEAYSPFPVHGLAEAVGYPGNRLAPVVFTCAVLGGICGFLLQWYSATIHYPINIGGRPLNSWPMFIPITFEC